MPSIIGVRKLPLLVAEVPRTPWKKRGMKTIVPNIPNPVQAIANIDRLTTRLRYMVSGMIGSAARISTRTRTMAETAATVSSPTIWTDSHSYWTSAHDSASSSETMATTSAAMPATSICLDTDAGFTLGKNLASRNRIGSPSGMLM